MKESECESHIKDLKQRKFILYFKLCSISRPIITLKLLGLPGKNDH